MVEKATSHSIVTQPKTTDKGGNSYREGVFAALLKKGFALCNPFVANKVTSVTLFSSPPRPPLAIIADKIVGLSYPKFALLATRGETLKALVEEQRTILARKTYSLDTVWWRVNYCVK